MAHHASHSSSEEFGHIIPIRIYLTVLALLLVLTVVTVAVSRVDFGPWNLVVAMLIASIKAGAVALFFMHLKYENPLVWLYVLIPVLLLGLMLGGVFLDNPTRNDPAPFSVPGATGKGPPGSMPPVAPEPHHS